MDPGAYSSSERGRVVRAVEGYWAFHPSPLPHRFELPQPVATLLDEATGAVHRLGGVGRLIPNPHLLIGPHLRLEAVLSSKIEGTKTDVGQLLRYEAGDSSDAVDVDDAREVGNYVVALEHGLDRLAGGFPVSIRLLREMHAKLLDGVRGQWRHPGELRSSPVWIGGPTLDRAVFVPPPPEAMGEALDDLERFLHRRDLPLLVQLAVTHYQFEVIHPFLDGNGRLGRLLIPMMLVERGVLPQPLLYLSGYLERFRSDYYDHLLRVSQTGNFIPWLEFFFEGVRYQAREAEERTVRLVDLQHLLRSELLEEGRPNSVVRLAESLFSMPITTARQVSNRLEVTAPTAHAALHTLVERGDLIEITGQGRNRIYRAPQVYDAVFGDVELPSDDDHRQQRLDLE